MPLLSIKSYKKKNPGWYSKCHSVAVGLVVANEHINNHWDLEEISKEVNTLSLLLNY